MEPTQKLLTEGQLRYKRYGLVHMFCACMQSETCKPWLEGRKAMTETKQTNQEMNESHLAN